MKRFLEFAAAALVLVVATLSIWHWRFVAVPDALPELKLASPLVGWKVKPHCKYEIVQENGNPVLRLEREKSSEKLPSIYVWLGEAGGLDGVAAVHIRCKARWEDVKVGSQGYMLARIVTMMRDAEGKVMHPPDFGMTSGKGSKDWHHCEAVFKVTEDMEDLGIEISMLGAAGLLEVKDLSVVAVRDRSWVPAATAAVLAGWILFVYLLIRLHANAPAPWRSLAASAAVIAISWFFVFPQTKGQLFPVFENFEVGELNVSPPATPPAVDKSPPELPPAVVPAPPIANPAVVPEKSVGPELKVVEPESPAQDEAPAAKPKSEPVAHSSGALHKFLRVVDHRLPVAHVGLFIGVTLLILFVTGRGNQWRIPLVLAVLSELVPELTDHLGGWDDWADVLQNFVGVGLAVLLWSRLPALRKLSSLADRKSLSRG